MNNLWTINIGQPKLSNPLKRFRNRKKLIHNKNSLSPGHSIGGIFDFQSVQSPKRRSEDLRIEQLRYQIELKEKEIKRLKRMNMIENPERRNLSVVHGTSLTPDPTERYALQRKYSTNDPITGLSKEITYWSKPNEKERYSSVYRNPITGGFDRRLKKYGKMIL